MSLVTNGVAQSSGRSAKYAHMASKLSGASSAITEKTDESMIANHAEVLEAGNKMSKHMQSLVEKFIELHYAL